VHEQIFAAPLQAEYPVALYARFQVVRHRPAQTGFTHDSGDQAASAQMRGEAAQHSFDFGQFGHGMRDAGKRHSLSLCPNYLGPA
jgi:hypothetical protein